MGGRMASALLRPLWSSQLTGANGQSATADVGSCPWLTFCGHVDGATTLTVMLSSDGTTWYAGPTLSVSGAGQFYLNVTLGVQFVALQSSGSVTATAFVSAKD
jgi:hypothetical protein